MLDIKRVIDLRAAEKSSDLPSGDYATARCKLPAVDNALVLELVAPEGKGHCSATEESVFLFVLCGQFSVNGKTMVAGEGANIAAGMAFDWSAVPGTKLFAMRVTETEAVDPSMVCINPCTRMSPSMPPSTEYLTSPVPTCESAVAWRAKEGQFYGGIWASTPYQRKQIPYMHYEFMYLLDGKVTFVNEAGISQTFKAGDALLVYRGARCSWDSREQVKKIYVIFRPA